MDRRKFLCQITAAGTGVVAKVELASAAATEKRNGKPQKKETRSVRYQVQGFTCITCAVGLEVMLRGLAGVTRASASYPANTVEIGFDDGLINGQSLKQFITECGFSVA